MSIDVGGWCGWDVDPSGVCPSWSTYTDEQRETALAIATAIMWAATGRRYGPCQVTVYPCQDRYTAERYRAYPVWWHGDGDSCTAPIPHLYDGQWSDCGCGTGCCCRPQCEVMLDGPVASITKVTIDGVVIPSTEYRVDVVNGAYLLVKTSSGCWPTCQVVGGDPGGEHIFSVTYARGVAVPAVLARATAILACEFAKSIAGSPCSLPRRLSSITRQGVTADLVATEIDVNTFQTGISEVDMVIRALNPSHRTRPPVVLSPDMPTARDHMTIIGGP